MVTELHELRDAYGSTEGNEVFEPESESKVHDNEGERQIEDDRPNGKPKNKGSKKGPKKRKKGKGEKYYNFI